MEFLKDIWWIHKAVLKNQSNYFCKQKQDSLETEKHLLQFNFIAKTAMHIAITCNTTYEKCTFNKLYKNSKLWVANLHILCQKEVIVPLILMLF